MIYHGDCREILPKLQFDYILTDPPYGLNLKLNRRSERIQGDSDTGLRDWLIGFLRDKPAIIFGSPKIQAPLGIRLKLIWDKSELAGMGNLDFPWKLTHEELYVMGEGFKRYRSRRGSVLRVPLRPRWTNHPDAVNNEHPAEKPLSLIRELVWVCPGVVADPFCGTGTTLLAAKSIGKESIGIELEERWCEIAVDRLSRAVQRPLIAPAEAGWRE